MVCHPERRPAGTLGWLFAAGTFLSRLGKWWRFAEDVGTSDVDGGAKVIAAVCFACGFG
jgi:hypothetical protein